MEFVLRIWSFPVTWKCPASHEQTSSWFNVQVSKLPITNDSCLPCRIRTKSTSVIGLFSIGETSST